MNADTQREIARTLVNQIAEIRGLTPPWPAYDVELPDWVAEEDVSEWDVMELGAFRERLLSEDARKAGGVFYTPPEVADFMNRFSIEPVMDRLESADDPSSVLDVVTIDPTCGAGVFLVSAARLIARRYASLIAGSEATDPMVRLVMPEVLSECVFGVDIDPVAVDLAKSVLWLEIGGTEPISFMDRNVIVGSVLDRDQIPPKLAERLGSRQRFRAHQEVATL